MPLQRTVPRSAIRSRQLSFVVRDGMAYWVIDEEMIPRRVGRGCNNLGTPVSYEGKANQTLGVETR